MSRTTEKITQVCLFVGGIALSVAFWTFYYQYVRPPKPPAVASAPIAKSLDFTNTIAGADFSTGLMPPAQPSRKAAAKLKKPRHVGLWTSTKGALTWKSGDVHARSIQIPKNMDSNDPNWTIAPAPIDSWAIQLPVTGIHGDKCYRTRKEVANVIPIDEIPCPNELTPAPVVGLSDPPITHFNGIANPDCSKGPC